MLYREFMHIIIAYFSSTKRNEFIFDILIPAFIVIGGRFCIEDIDKKVELLNSILTIASIIMGFTIASITVILTTNSQNMKDAKTIDGGKRALNIQLTMFQCLLIPFFYVAVFCLISIMFIIFVLSFGLYEDHRTLVDIAIFSVLHIVTVEIRSITNLFFLVLPHRENSNT